MPDPELLEFGGFRVHLLIPHTVVGTIISDRPTWPGLTVEDHGGGVLLYLRDGKPVLRTYRHSTETQTRVFVHAVEDVYLQEPGMTVRIAGDGTWRGFGPTGAWTSKPYELHQRDAHRSTVHFSRVKTNTLFTAGVEYRFLGGHWRLRSDGGFTKLLNMPPAGIPWQGAQVFGRDFELAGTVSDPNEILRRWELAGAQPNIGQMHFLGSTGGAGAVTNKSGRTPPSPAPKDFDYTPYCWLWNPRGWRKLAAGQSITQTVSLRSL